MWKHKIEPIYIYKSFLNVLLNFVLVKKFKLQQN